ncbi:MAG TPA: TonB-dependent receptor [Chitinophaga sp.]|uniref:TonB-dependent receptor n=1 Tax=Chitinophaga sp. TaxID=1869181 RepID=UPI002B9974B0|nr:TonB-dependent receptor [Chitinophaga sp.]HVI45043.1 TonB-dependent receptor [Chitinophaga sp.]
MYAKIFCTIALSGWMLFVFSQSRKDTGIGNPQLLEEVIITAGKKEEKLLSADISVSYLSSKKIQETRTWGLSGLTGVIPNYQYGDIGAGYQQVIALRGISVFSGNPSVATYIDGVNAMNITANGIQLMDVERIEVLRGPQGTLYGRNAMGGVLNIITRQPGNNTSGFAEVSIGNNGLQRYGAGIKTPLLKDRLFVGFSGQLQEKHGYYRNDLSGSKLQGTAADGVRIGDERSFYGNIFLRYLSDKHFDITFNIKGQLDASPFASAYFLTVPDPQTAMDDPFVFRVNRLGKSKRQLLNQSLSFNYHLPRVKISGTTAFQYVGLSYDNIDFIDQSPRDIGFASSFHSRPGDVIPQRIISQEFRVASSGSESRLQWTTGAYLFMQLNDQRTASTYLREAAPLFGIADSLAESYFPRTSVYQADERNTGIAFFGQADYHFSNRLKLTAGLRYDYEKRTGDIVAFSIVKNTGSVYTLPESHKEKAFTALSPKVAVSYEISAQQHIYLSYTRGFRAGGLNMFTTLSGATSYDPEYSDNYELGYKLLSADRKWSVAAAAFYMNWRGLQLYYSPDGVSSVISNLGRVRSIGAELEITALPVRRLQLDMSLGANNARYGNFTLDGQHISGKRTIMAPITTLYLGAQYTVPLARGINASMRGEWRNTGDQYFDITNTIRQPSYSLISIRTGISAENMELMWWVQNLTDQHYIAYATPFSSFSKSTLLGSPRSFGVTITGKF